MQLDESATHGTLTSHLLEGYRLFVPDFMSFERGMLVGIEHGSESVRNNISLVVYAPPPFPPCVFVTSTQVRRSWLVWRASVIYPTVVSVVHS